MAFSEYLVVIITPPYCKMSLLITSNIEAIWVYTHSFLRKSPLNFKAINILRKFLNPFTELAYYFLTSFLLSRLWNYSLCSS